MDTLSTAALQHDGSFSWRRVATVWTYYSPVLKMQLWLWPLVAAGIYLMGLFMALSPFPAESSFAVSDLLMLISFGPLMLARSNALVCETMLPVRADEKFVFFLLYFLIVVPVLTMLTAGALHLAATMILGVERLQDYTAFLTQRSQMIGYTYGIGVFSDVIGIVACLLGVTAFTRNRTLAGVGFVIGSGIVVGIISSIFGIIMAFTSGIFDGFLQFGEIVESNSGNTQAMVEEMYELPVMRLMMIVISSITAIVSILLGYLLLRRIRNRQI